MSCKITICSKRLLHYRQTHVQPICNRLTNTCQSVFLFSENAVLVVVFLIWFFQYLHDIFFEFICQSLWTDSHQLKDLFLNCTIAEDTMKSIMQRHEQFDFVAIFIWSPAWFHQNVMHIFNKRFVFSFWFVQKRSAIVVFHLHNFSDKKKTRVRLILCEVYQQTGSLFSRRFWSNIRTRTQQFTLIMSRIEWQNLVSLAVQIQ